MNLHLQISSKNYGCLCSSQYDQQCVKWGTERFIECFIEEDHLCDLVVRVLGYRSGGPGSISGTTRFSGGGEREENSSGSRTGSTQPREYNWGATWYKSSGSCLENREYGWRDLSRWSRGTLYPHKLAITSPTSGGRLVGIVRSRTWSLVLVFHRRVCDKQFCLPNRKLN
jgi:hypothetical protein